VFFSEEKAEPALREAKDFYLSATPTFPAMAGMPPPAKDQKSFASFLQKRRTLPYECHPQEAVDRDDLRQGSRIRRYRFGCLDRAGKHTDGGRQADRPSPFETQAAQRCAVRGFRRDARG
jgi:hypothetical protein